MSGRITALKVQKGNPQRINVFLDGEFAFGLSRITAAWLQVGQELSDEKIASLRELDLREQALQQAMRLLERHERSEAEIRRHLEKKQFSEAVIQDVLTRLKQTDLVNDARFASLWIENRRQYRPRSRKALAYEMRRQGLSQHTIDQALKQISAADEQEMAYQAASKYARRLRNLDWNAFRGKLGGFLARRGFSYEVCETVIRRVWKELTPVAQKTEDF